VASFSSAAIFSNLIAFSTYSASIFIRVTLATSMRWDNATKSQFVSLSV
jgi:hypothetical protein